MSKADKEAAAIIEAYRKLPKSVTTRRTGSASRFRSAAGRQKQLARDSVGSYTRYFPRTSTSRLRYGPTWSTASAVQARNRVVDKMYGPGAYRSARSTAAASRKRKKVWSGDGTYKSPVGFKKSTIATNALIDGGRGFATDVPVFSKVSDTGAVTISHKEFVQTVYGAPDENFDAETFDINPGIEKTFPWLSQIAQNYEEYEIKQLIFTYVSTCESVLSTNGQAGQIMIAPTYSARSSVIGSVAGMMNTQGVGAASFNKPLQIGVECNHKKLPNTSPGGKLIRGAGSAYTTVSDIDAYDHGKLTVGKNGTPGDLMSKTIGQLWVSYKVVLRRPRMYSSAGKNLNQDVFAISSSAQQQWIGAAKCQLWPADFIVSNVVHWAGNSIGVTLSDAGFGNFSEMDGQLGWDTVGDASSVLGNPGQPWNLYSTGLQINFPNSFTGYVEITLNTQLVRPGSLSTAYYGFCALGKTGDVKAVNDLYIHRGNGVKEAGTAYFKIPEIHTGMSSCYDFQLGSKPIFFETGDPYTSTEAALKLHVYVGHASDAERNSVTIAFAASASTNGFAEAMQIKVAEYQALLDVNAPIDAPVEVRYANWLTDSGGHPQQRATEENRFVQPE